MRYYLFIDESGDHGIKNIDPSFPNFILCGILVAEDSYSRIRSDMNSLKERIWSSKDVVFHSTAIRKWKDEFSIFYDKEKREHCLSEISRISREHDYTIVSAIVNKPHYVRRYGKVGDVYSMSLSFVIERTIYYLDSLNEADISLDIVIEKRGKKEDANLLNHYNSVCSKGTHFVSPSRIKKYNFKLHFKGKKENINGLQLADLVAYPIARYSMDRERHNPAFEEFKDKFYKKGSRIYGMKEFP